MLKKEVLQSYSPQRKKYKKLLRHINQLASQKMGYPVSLLTYLGVVNNQSLGISPGTLANVLLNNVGDPFIDSQTSLMEVKRYERKIIQMLEKYYGLSKNEARGYVTTGGTEGNFAGLWWSKRYLISCALNQLIDTNNKTTMQIKEKQDLTRALVKIPMNDYKNRAIQLQKILDMENTIEVYKNKSQQLLTPTVFYSKESTHYSVPKISEILRMNIRTVKTNEDGTIDLDNFKRELLLHVGAYPSSSIILIANIGTTITGAIDNVPEMKKILDALKNKVTYTIHVDGALTGFVIPILKYFGDIPNYFNALGVNTFVFSAHKYPGLSQPCGIILASKTFLDKAFEKSARNIEYVGNIRDITITGSRSGLNVLMFYNALRALGFGCSKPKLLKKMVIENLEHARYLYDKLVLIYGKDKVFYPFHFNVLFPKPSMKLAKKYQLMLIGDKASVCVLTNVTRELIDQFILDLTLEKEKAAMKTETEHFPHSIKTLTKEYAVSATDLFTRAFCTSEPTTKHLGITADDYIAFSSEVIQKAVEDGISKIAVNDNNQVIGLILSEDITDTFKPSFENYPKMKPIYALLNQISEPFLKGKKFAKGKVVHTWIIATDEEYRLKGLSMELIMAHAEIAMKKGFQFMYVEFTNVVSEKLSHHFKMLECCNILNYEDFVFEGKSPLKGLKGRTSSYLAALNQKDNLEAFTKCYKETEKVPTH